MSTVTLSADTDDRLILRLQGWGVIRRWQLLISGAEIETGQGRFTASSATLSGQITLTDELESTVGSYEQLWLGGSEAEIAWLGTTHSWTAERSWFHTSFSISLDGRELVRFDHQRDAYEPVVVTITDDQIDAELVMFGCWLTLVLTAPRG